MDLNLNNLKSFTWIMLILIFVFAVCSSILFIFIFNKDLFFDAELIKLLLLGLSFSLPIWLFNSFLVGFILRTTNADFEELTKGVGSLGSLFSLPIIYIPILIRFFWEISLKTGVIIALCIQLGIAIVIFLADFILSKKAKR